MKTDLVLTIIARDRPGVVERVADVVAAHEGNWVDSSMARLCGQFAGLLRVQVPQARAAALEAALLRLGETDMKVTVCAAASAGTSPPGRAVKLELTGLDHTGIVLEVTRVLARHKVNVEQLETAVFPASISGEAMFRARAQMRLPEGLDIATLRAALETIAQDIMVDIDLCAEPET